MQRFFDRQVLLWRVEFKHLTAFALIAYAHTHVHMYVCMYVCMYVESASLEK
jgi:hypothetical protein